MRWKMVIGIASLALLLFAASMAPAGAATSIRGAATGTSSATGSHSLAVRASAPAPVIGEPVMETPDPNLPLNAERPAPVIGEPVMETPDPNQPQDVNTTSRTIRR